MESPCEQQNSWDDWILPNFFSNEAQYIRIAVSVTWSLVGIERATRRHVSSVLSYSNRALHYSDGGLFPFMNVYSAVNLFKLSNMTIPDRIFHEYLHYRSKSSRINQGFSTWWAKTMDSHWRCDKPHEDCLWWWWTWSRNQRSNNLPRQCPMSCFTSNC